MEYAAQQRAAALCLEFCEKRQACAGIPPSVTEQLRRECGAGGWLPLLYPSGPPLDGISLLERAVREGDVGWTAAFSGVRSQAPMVLVLQGEDFCSPRFPCRRPSATHSLIWLDARAS